LDIPDAAALNVGNGIHVILAGGAQASNIFWQVGSSAHLEQPRFLREQ